MNANTVQILIAGTIHAAAIGSDDTELGAELESVTTITTFGTGYRATIAATVDQLGRIADQLDAVADAMADSEDARERRAGRAMAAKAADLGALWERLTEDCATERANTRDSERAAYGRTLDSFAPTTEGN